MSGFSPPWPPARSLRLGECDMRDFFCSLQQMPIMSYLPDLLKVRSGPGVSADREQRAEERGQMTDDRRETAEDLKA